MNVQMLNVLKLDLVAKDVKVIKDSIAICLAQWNAHHGQAFLIHQAYFKAWILIADVQSKFIRCILSCGFIYPAQFLCLYIQFAPKSFCTKKNLSDVYFENGASFCLLFFYYFVFFHIRSCYCFLLIWTSKIFRFFFDIHMYLR